MDTLMAQAIRGTADFRKTSVPWTLDEPYPQSYYGFDPATSTWASKPTYSLEESTSKDSLAVTTIELYTWNIDFILPFAAARMRPALAHLHQIIHLSLPNVAVLSFFKNYGTSILISKRLPITSVFRVHYSLTRMDRDAQFVDVLVGPERKRIRLCNTHLESMALDPPYRPPQMQVVSQYMHQDGVNAANSAGDFNAIQPVQREGSALRDGTMGEECVLNHSHHQAIRVQAGSKCTLQQTRVYCINYLP
ncbi:hypothetical protein BDV06DRAFT_221696 [Aspergillus oleicola]